MRCKFILVVLLLLCPFRVFSQDVEEWQMPELSSYRDYLDDSRSFLFTPWRYAFRGLPYEMNDSFLFDISSKSLSDSRVPYMALRAANLITAQNFIPQSDFFTFEPEAETTGGYAKLAISSRTYTHSLMAGYALNRYEKDGYALEFAAQRAFGRSMLVDGVFTDCYDFAVSSAVDLGSGGVLRVTALASPTERSMARSATREAYEISSDNLYNSSWGMQHERQRSVNVRRSIEPIVTVNHSLSIKDKMQLNTSLAVRYGRNSYSALSWQGTPNPYPDYYAYMPSAQESWDAADLVAQSWASDESIRQINFESLYSLNNTDDGRAKYIIEERVTEPLVASLVSKLSYNDFTVSLLASLQSEYNYKELNSLLGGGYWLDIDSFVEQDNDVKDKTQNNMLDPNRHILEGERFGYNYSINNLMAGARLGYDKRLGAFEVVVGADIAVISTQRIGYYEKENFLGAESLGASRVAVGIDGGIAAEASWHFSPRSKISLSTSLSTRAPRASELFLSEQYRNAFTPMVGNSELFSVEAAYKFSSDRLRINSSLYYYGQSGATELRNVYDDMLHSYVHYPICGIGRSYLGLEVAAEVCLYDNLWLGGVVSLSENTYSTNPMASAYKESTSEELIDSEELFYSGKHIGGMAEDFGVMSLSYRDYNWNLRLSAVVIDGNYERLSPLRYTARIVKFLSSETNYKTIQTQYKAPLAFSLDLFGGYTFRFIDGGSLGLYCSVSNLLNNSSMERAIFQNDRFYRNGWELCPQPSRMYYALPLNFSFSAILRF